MFDILVYPNAEGSSTVDVFFNAWPEKRLHLQNKPKYYFVLERGKAFVLSLKKLSN